MTITAYQPKHMAPRGDRHDPAVDSLAIIQGHIWGALDQISAPGQPAEHLVRAENALRSLATELGHPELVEPPR
jgi:hypothetical protein